MFEASGTQLTWIPASAGMTVSKLTVKRPTIEKAKDREDRLSLTHRGPPLGQPGRQEALQRLLHLH